MEISLSVIQSAQYSLKHHYQKYKKQVFQTILTADSTDRMYTPQQLPQQNASGIKRRAPPPTADEQLQDKISIQLPPI